MSVANISILGLRIMTDSDLRQLFDRNEITDVLIRYATAIDHKDWDLLSAVFVDGADCDYTPLGGERAAFPAICRWLTEALSGFATQHMLTNYVIEVEGDLATARTYLQATHTPTDETGARSLTFKGTYVDGLIRTSAGWRIQHRTLYSHDHSPPEMA